MTETKLRQLIIDFDDNCLDFDYCEDLVIELLPLVKTIIEQRDQLLAALDKANEQLDNWLINPKQTE